MSTVHGLPSSQLAAPWLQPVALLHRSAVHGLPSSQPSGSWTQPAPPSQWPLYTIAHFRYQSRG